jgi:hypothetical protein
MKRTFRSSSLPTLLFTVSTCGIICLFPSTSWARGYGGSHGGSVHVSGYYRSNGTYVHSYTRSAPQGGWSYGSSSSGYGAPTASYGSDPENDNVLGSPITDPESPQEPSIPSPVTTSPSDISTNSSSTTFPAAPDVSINQSSDSLDSSENTSNDWNFPQTSCGDKPTGGSDTWYPVFIDKGSLSQIRKRYCADALATIREKTNIESVQVASFNDRDKAVRFAQVIGGDVGASTSPESSSPAKEEVAVTKPSRASQPTTPSSTQSVSALSSTPQLVTSSPVAQANTNQNGVLSMFGALFVLGLGFGVGFKSVKKSHRG